MRITPIEGLSPLEHLEAGYRLWLSAKDNVGLSRELPLAFGNYGSFLRAQRRISYLQKLVEGKSYSAYLVREDAGGVEGLSSAQAHDPSPNPLGRGRNIELSYWTRDYKDSEYAAKAGSEILKHTMQAVAQRFRLGPDDMLWSVSLPDDVAKQDALETCRFHPVSAPQPYDLGDRVTEARQLWAATPTFVWPNNAQNA